MIGALGYLAARSALNAARRHAARLREPRYLAAFLLGIAWLWVVLVAQRPREAPIPAGPRWETVLAAALAAVVVWGWIRGGHRRVLAFSPAEVTWLFPAPLTRRALVQCRLARLQLRILLSTAIWTLLFARERGGAGPALQALAIWIVISTVVLHRLGAAFVLGSLGHHGRFGLRRRAGSMALLALAAGALAWGAGESLPALGAAARAGPEALLAALDRAARQPPAAVMLWPFRLLARPLLAPSPDAWWEAIGPALLLLALHYVWVLRADAAFEEAAAEAALAKARRGARGGSGDPPGARGAVSPPLFPLAPTGWPGTAILWKNLAAVLRRRRAGLMAGGLAVLGALLGGLAAWAPGGTLPEIAGSLALVWAGFLFVLGPQWVRNDLRGELRHSDLVRSYPLPGWAVVAAEAAGSAITLTLLELALALLAQLALLGDPGVPFAPGERWAALAALAVVLPGLNYLAMLIQNGAAVLFPAWVRPGSAVPGGGIASLGQTMMAALASLLVLGVLAAPGAGLGLMIGATLAPALGPWALLPAAAGASAGFALVAAALVRWLGRVFDRSEGC